MIRPITAMIFFGYATASAQLRVGVVRMDAIFTKDPEKVAYTEKAKAQLEAINNNERRKSLEEKIQAYQQIEEEMKKLIKTFDQLPTETQKKEANQKFEELRNERQKKIAEYQASSQEFSEFRAKETQALNQEMALKLREILNRNTAIVVEIVLSQ